MPRKKKVPLPARQPWEGKARVRIRLPDSDPPRYYNSDNNGRDNIWVTVGYTTWPTDEWIAKYSRGYPNNDTRNWDFFGDLIDLWAGYHDE